MLFFFFVCLGRIHRLAESGWQPIMRAAASKGAADLLMGHPVHGGALIQVASLVEACAIANSIAPEHMASTTSLSFTSAALYSTVWPVLRLRMRTHGITCRCSSVATRSGAWPTP